MYPSHVGSALILPVCNISRLFFFPPAARLNPRFGLWASAEVT